MRRIRWIWAAGLMLLGVLIGALGVSHFGPSRPRPLWGNSGGEPPLIGKATYEPIDPGLAGTLNELFVRVARQVRPTVVYIMVESRLRAVPPQDRFHQFDPGDPRWRRFFERPRQGAGSGVIVSSDGYIVTNDHVVEGASEGGIRVQLADKREFTARLVGRDPSTDLAVLKIEARGLPAIAIGNSDAVQVGEWVLAIGNPFRLTSTVTAGIVSATGRNVGVINERFGIEDFIQTDAAINPGNSGGALVNLRGELIGINTAIATEGGSYEGYGFAIPSNMVRRIAEDLIRYGTVRRGFIGVEIADVDDALARRVGLERVMGAVINRVLPNGAAEQAGLRVGDIILQVGGEEVEAANHLQSKVLKYRPGDRVPLLIWREGRAYTVQVVLQGPEDQPIRRWAQAPSEEADTSGGSFPLPLPDPENPEEATLSAWGLVLEPISPDRKRGQGTSAGVRIRQITPGSLAARRGLEPGSVLLAIGRHSVRSLVEAQQALSQALRAGGALLKVRRPDGTVLYYDLYWTQR
ncbi:MAG: Do family serine endopeptidase [Bacteroidetes bacterium]|nr:Do family serine endopeptidase [Rhodothermia bacterium]MCS7154779.1 Do family serine endopeptidase [Bacteroidota bacterium]MCX7907064.1 Do family serine endopeptidase [Bacteroidota bacterium]MDW8137572.1 Do family serine endopeptidase [Bacteroidota bacterium]MDW8285474.1 Do family serine endopeptidase [Bacteroidota bacterium]